MKTNLLATRLSRALACAMLAPASTIALAQTATTTPDGALEAKQLDTIVVQAEIAFRNRTDDIAPVLSYDLEYFQRFEPNTVGDMLKRVPGVTFVGSDIMEFDGVMMRGMAAGYTQVLINGKTVPGAGDDRSFARQNAHQSRASSSAAARGPPPEVATATLGLPGICRSPASPRNCSAAS